MAYIKPSQAKRLIAAENIEHKVMKSKKSPKAIEKAYNEAFKSKKVKHAPKGRK